MARLEKAKVDSGRYGCHYVSPEPASGSSSLQNMLGYFQDYIPQTYYTSSSNNSSSSSSGGYINTETVLWARFETTDCNDHCMEHLSKQDSSLPLILILGLSTGFNIWAISPNGDARLVYSACNDGEGCVRIATLLKSPSIELGVDPFNNQRPLLAIVRKGSVGYKPSFSTLVIKSLRGASEKNEIKNIEFERNSILDVKCNRRVIVIILQKRLVLLDAATLDKKWIVKTGYHTIDQWTNPIALGDRWLAFSDTKIHTHLLSIGGVSEELTPPVASAVMNTVKKGLSALSDTISGLTGHSNTSSTRTSAMNSGHSNEDSAPVVTILDLHCRSHSGGTEVRVSELRKGDDGLVAHFLAHNGSDTYITQLQFNNSGDILFSANSDGQCFNIFHISPTIHGSVIDCRVSHLYSLYRGSTKGIVQDVAFSNDSRWIAVSTRNGTTHLFPISPYGGAVTVRTHKYSRVVNRLSRFHTSAGITVSSDNSSHQQQQLQQSQQQPLTLSSLQQIKQPHLPGSKDRSIVSSSEDSSDCSSSICVRALFAVPVQSNLNSIKSIDFSDEKVLYSLYVIGSDGSVTEHSLEPIRSTTAASEDDNESLIELQCLPRLTWKLLSVPLKDGVYSSPIDEDNPLVMAHRLYQDHLETMKSTAGLLDQESWLSQVELLTYAPPTRRLWMGPQFTFKTVSTERGELTASTEEEEEKQLSSPLAVLPSSRDFINAPDISLKSVRSSAVTMAITGGREGDSRANLDEGVEVFGSWNDVAPRLKGEADLELLIHDAMMDQSTDQSSSLPFISSSSLTATTHGFNTSY